MAIKGFTQGDKGVRKKPTSGGPSTSLARPKPQGRYGDTVNSVNSKAKGSDIKPVQSPYVPASPGLGTGGSMNQYGVPGTGVVSQTPSPGMGAGGNYSPTAAPGTNVGNVNPGAPMTGAGADYGYTPQGLGMLYQNPTPLAQDVLQGLGIDNYGLATALADAFNPALYAFMMQSKGMGDQSDAATIDAISSYLTQMTTPGGSMPGMADLMANVLGSGDVGSSPLAALLSSGTPEEQVRTLETFLQAAGYGNNPLAQRAYGNAADYYGNEYLSSVMKGDPAGSSYVDFLQSSPLARWMGLR